jgi:hypothetical protein
MMIDVMRLTDGVGDTHSFIAHGYVDKKEFISAIEFEYEVDVFAESDVEYVLARNTPVNDESERSYLVNIVKTQGRGVYKATYAKLS